MTRIESAWPAHPDYRIDLVPIGRVRVWGGDTLLAESTDAVRLEETRHAPQIYLPLADIRREHFVDSDHRTICPFKGEARYLSLADDRSDPERANVLWYYPDPMPEVAGIDGMGAFYSDRVRIEVEQPWPGGDADALDVVPFPATEDSLWGDARDLAALIDVQPDGNGNFVQPAYRKTARNVIEGSQMLAQVIVSASKAVPDQSVISANIILARPAGFDVPLAFRPEIVRQGRSFATVRVLIEQEGKHCGSAQVMLGVPTADLVKGHVEMPQMPAPGECRPFDFGMTGRDARFVADSYERDPDKTGPSEVNAWVRYRDRPAEQYLNQALLAQFTGHMTIAGALRPYAGLGEAQAHVTLSTGILAISLTLHDRIDVGEWMLYCNPATHIGAGLAHGDGKVFASDGRLLASYSVEAMIRPLVDGQFSSTPGVM